MSSSSGQTAAHPAAGSLLVLRSGQLRATRSAGEQWDVLRRLEPARDGWRRSERDPRKPWSRRALVFSELKTSGGSSPSGFIPAETNKDGRWGCSGAGSDLRPAVFHPEEVPGGGAVLTWSLASRDSRLLCCPTETHLTFLDFPRTHTHG